MYSAVIRNTYAELFKLAEANLPKSVRENTVKVASVEPVLSDILKKLWESPK